ncbi:helix-turn-helix domain-containing protein [Micromonospora sp. NPDC092111]|uniref:helix-turn-helix domain-containing protein n=1 Tax=Micromonospora sp. NPDC092111 TaxID=3364289 RepID=UPI00381B62D0
MLHMIMSWLLHRVVFAGIAWGRPGLALVGLSIVEQRYRAVLSVQAGDPVVEVAARDGVSRQTVHAWLARYAEAGLAGLQDRSRRPRGCAHQASPEVEALVCELRRHHSRWVPVGSPSSLDAMAARSRCRRG